MIGEEETVIVKLTADGHLSELNSTNPQDIKSNLNQLVLKLQSPPFQTSLADFSTDYVTVERQQGNSDHVSFYAFMQESAEMHFGDEEDSDTDQDVQKAFLGKKTKIRAVILDTATTHNLYLLYCSDFKGE